MAVIKLRLIPIARRIAAAVALSLAAYVAAGTIGGAIPTNAGWRAPPRGVPIWVESNGVHVGIVVPKTAAGVDWRPLLRAGHLRDPRFARYGHASFGWGDAAFYAATPTWADVRPWTVARAAWGGGPTFVHVDHVPAPRGAKRILLTPGQYRRLAAALRASIAPRPARRPGYGANDAFYTGTGRYSAIRTCNAWAGDVLRTAGVRVGAWTPFPATVTWWF